MKNNIQKFENSVFVGFVSEDEGENFDTYLVNNSDLKYDQVKMEFGSIEDDLYLGPSTEYFKEFLPNSFIKIDSYWYGLLDFINWYRIDLIQDGKTLKELIFSVRGPSDRVGIKAQIPVLNKTGRIIELEKRSNIPTELG